MRQYSIDKVSIGWAGLDFKEGLAPGTCIVESRNAKSFSQKPAGFGRVIRVYNPDRSGSMKVTVMQESKLHQQLTDIAKTDRLLRNQVFPMLMTDDSTGEDFKYKNAYIESDPDESRGTESATFDWVFLFEEKTKASDASDKNLIGA